MIKYLPLALPALGLAAIALCGTQAPVEDLSFGRQGGTIGNVPLPQDVARVRVGHDCVTPSADVPLRYLHSMIVADEADGANVRIVGFDAGWAASRAGTVQVLLACAT